MHFRLLIIALLTILPAIASGAPPIEVRIEGWPWKLPVPAGFCSLDPTKIPDKQLSDFQQTLVPPSGILAGFLADCTELQAFRKGEHPPRRTLSYFVAKDDALNPFVRSLNRQGYIHAMVQQLPVFGTKNLATKSEQDLKEKTGVDVSIPRLSTIGQDDYGFYTASQADVPKPPAGKPFSVATVSGGTKIGMHIFSINLTRSYDTDKIFAPMLTEAQAVTRDFVRANPW